MNSIVGPRLGPGLCSRALSLRLSLSSSARTARSWLPARNYAAGAKWPQQQSIAGVASDDLIKYGVPGVLLLGTLLLVSRKDSQPAPTAPAVAAPAAPAPALPVEDSYIQVGQFQFHQREVEEAFIANPDQFIHDVMHLSSDLAPLTADDSSARYRALCLFARNILLVDTACTSDVLRIARIHFEKAIRAERETFAYRLAVYAAAVRGSVAGLASAFGSYVGGHLASLVAAVESQCRLLWQKVNLLKQ